MIRSRCSLFGAIAAILAFAVAGSAQQQKEHKKPKNSDIENIGNRDINKGNIDFVSIEREIAWGGELAQQVEQEQRLLQDSIVNEYVNRLGQNIVRNSDAKVPFTIKVIDSDEINAFALPGGFFYVNTGLILAADDEAELAGVMAHEIAHVAARHGAEQESRSQLVSYMAIPLVFMAGPIGLGIQQAASLLVPLTFLKFSRGMEQEADYLGVQYLYKAGYDPTAMVRFFEKLQAKEKANPGSMSNLFATHPPTGDRLRRVEETITNILPPADQYVETTSEFDRVRTRLGKIENNRPPENGNRPSLHRRTHKPDPKAPDPNDGGAPDDDNRPTVERPSEDSRYRLLASKLPIYQ